MCIRDRVKEVATKTNDVAGDGTTTATVLAQAMINEGMKNLAAGANPIVLRKGMKKATDAVVEAIAKMSQPIEGKDQIARVAAISASDDEVGALVADAMEKVSNDGVITIEESKTMKTELDLVEGMQFDRGYISAYMCTDKMCIRDSIVVICAGVAQKPGETRLDLLKRNKEVFQSIVGPVTQSGFNGLFLVATNPVDVMTRITYELSGFNARRVLGTGTALDTARLRYLLGKYLQADRCV